MNGCISLSNPMESTGHKWVILHRVTEFHQLGAPIRFMVLCKFCCFLYNLSHKAYRVHIDSTLGRPYRNGAADTLSFCQCLRNGINQFSVGFSHSTVYQCRKSPQNINACGIRCLLKGSGHRNKTGFRQSTGNQRNRGNRNTFVDNRHPIFSGNIISCFHQVFSFGANGVIYIIAETLHIR